MNVELNFLQSNYLSLVGLGSQHQQTMILCQGHMFLTIRGSFILVTMFHPQHRFSMLQSHADSASKKKYVKGWVSSKGYEARRYEIVPIVEINRVWKGTNRHRARIWKNFSRLCTKWTALFTIRYFHSHFQAITIARMQIYYHSHEELNLLFTCIVMALKISSLAIPSGILLLLEEDVMHLLKKFMRAFLIMWWRN